MSDKKILKITIALLFIFNSLFFFDDNLSSNDYVYEDNNNDFIHLSAESSLNCQWNLTWGGSNNEYGKKIEIDASNNKYLGGHTNSFGNGSYDVCLIKYNYSDILQWNVTWGGANNEYCEALGIDSSNNIYLGGYTNSFGNGYYDILLLKYNSSGELLWNLTWGGYYNDYCYGLTIDSFDNIYLVGSTESFGGGSYDVCLIKYSSSGKQFWNLTYGYSYDAFGYAIGVDLFNDIYISGTNTDNMDPLEDIFLTKYNSEGVLLWSSSWGYFDVVDVCKALTFDSLNNIYLGGYTYDFTYNKMLLLKYNSTGSLIWNITWSSELCKGMVMNSFDNLYLLGNYHIVKFNTSGMEIWNHYLTESVCYNSLTLDSKEDIYLIGESFSDIYVFKYSDDTDDDNLNDWEEINVYFTDPKDNDTDNDSMPDGWEVSNSLNPLIDDSSGDQDGDNLSNLDEFTYNTDPNDTDTDDDGLNDGEEVYSYSTDPNNSDSDDDGLNDGEEVNYYSANPNDPDSDDDGLNDGDEVYSYSTDPTDSDSDDDRLFDGEEVYSFLTNPNDPDTDGDILNDWEEVNSYSTDPNDSDSDDDGLNDGDEIYSYSTDPNDSDSDDDGLNDGEEIYSYSTDPNNSDSDDDGLNDGEEIYSYSTDPNNSDSDDDGLDDGEELFWYFTDPKDNDTDNDSMPDGWEVSNSLNPLIDDSSGDQDGDNLSNLDEFTYNTDPNDTDTDDDGLNDGDEIIIYLTDPNNADTDGDGFNDGEEVAQETNPNDFWSNPLITILIIIAIILVGVVLGFFMVWVLLKNKRREKRINKIKSTILSMQNQYTRVKIIEISDSSGVKTKNLIISTIKNMILNKEIKGRYFLTTKSLAFDQRIYIDKNNIDFEISEVIERDELGSKMRIKKTILSMSIKYDRLEISEIAEESRIFDEGLIIETINEMIGNKEVYAEYFSSTRTVMFNQQSNMDEIDRLMKTYKEWEGEKLSKK